jgi:hypothetical protein
MLEVPNRRDAILSTAPVAIRRFSGDFADGRAVAPEEIRTVIFLKANAIDPDSTYYRDTFRKMIATTYRQEGHWESILVLEAKKKQP